MFQTITIYPFFGWLILFVALLFYVITTAILFYHWRAYSEDEKKTPLFETIYFIISFAIILAAFLFLLTYKINP